MWLTEHRLLKDQALRLEGPAAQIKTCYTFNSATFPPEEDKSEDSPKPDWTNNSTNFYCYGRLGKSPENSDCIFFMDGNAVIEHGIHWVRYAMVTLCDTLKNKPPTLPPSSQIVDLIALTRAQELCQNKRVPLYTDSKYTIFVLHAHATTWKKRTFLTGAQSPIECHQETDCFLTYFNPDKWQWPIVEDIRGEQMSTYLLKLG